MHVLHEAERAATLLLDREANELEDVVRILLGQRQLVAADLERCPARDGTGEAQHEPSAGALALDHGGELAVHENAGALGQALGRLARVLDDERAAEAVRAAYAANRDRLRVGCAHYSTISSTTRSRDRAAPARTTVRSARAMRPLRPITLPTSSGATCSRKTTAPSPWASSTRT